jgi:T5SS/PEP-CTERM-associated repeat protein
LSVGDLGSGTLTINGGGAVSSGSGIFIGLDALGDVNVSGAGSSLTSTSFGTRIGFFASGALTIADGGAVSSADDAFVGIRPGSDGEVIVKGTASTWTIEDQLTVGHESTGELTIAQGGAVSNTLADVGRLAGGNGTVTVADAGSTWTVTALNVGGNLSAAGGSGTVNVKSGGLVEINGDTIVWNNGVIELQSGGTLDAYGTIQMNGGTFDFLGGTLHVDDFNGELKNQGGTLAPGHSAGATNIDGDYFQFAAATLEIEIGGTDAGSEFDTMKVAGEAILDGTLEVSLINSFTPSAGDTFEILTSGGGINESFDTELLPALPGGLFFEVEYNRNDVLLLTSGILGDYNRNGAVDAADYVVWRKTLRQGGSGLPADGDGNGQVDLNDLNVWRANFGNTAGSGAGSVAGTSSTTNPAVPEPASMAIVIVAVIFAACPVSTAKTRRKTDCSLSMRHLDISRQSAKQKIAAPGSHRPCLRQTDCRPRWKSCSAARRASTHVVVSIRGRADGH